MKSRVLRTAAAAGLVCAHASAAPPAAAPGPWAQVPALPTACYSSQDQWLDKNNAAIDAVQQALYSQQEANAAVEQKYNAAFSENPMAVAQAMQQAMLNDPENAQKYMERMVQTGEQARTEIPAQQQKEKQLEDESKTVVKQYEAALEKAMGPAEARWTALKKKMGTAEDSPMPIGPDPAWPEWAWQEWSRIQKDRDAGYAANCAQWWSATGGFQAYMKRYKDYLVRERIPNEKKLFDEVRLEQFKMMDVPTEGWRTTTDYEAAVDYMKMASTLYGQRMTDPWCRKGSFCE